MPSSTHDGLVALFSNDPTLAPRLLRDGPGAPRLPAFDEVTPTRGDLGSTVPSERRVDLALELRHRGRRVAVLLLEVQLRTDPDKPWTWPNYYASARDRLRCPVFLVVITPTRRIANWCRRSIVTPQLYFTPFVLGPDEVPAITDVNAARACPELGVLSALVHGRGAHGKRILWTAIQGIDRLDIDRRRIYTGLLKLLVIKDPSHPAELTMNIQEFTDKYGIDPEFQRFIDEYDGDEGEAIHAFWETVLIPQLSRGTPFSDFDDAIDALQGAIFDTLKARKVRVPRAIRAQIVECIDTVRLRTMLRRALRVQHAEDVLTRKRLPTAD